MTQPYPHRFPGITYAALLAELAREAQARFQAHARARERGRMTPADVAREAALIAALQEDCRRMAALAPGQNPNLPGTGRGTAAGGGGVPQHGLTWRARTDGIQRELRLRAAVYPAEIKQGRLTPAKAAHQVQCFEVLLAFYHDGLDWPEDPDQRAALYAEIMGPIYLFDPSVKSGKKGAWSMSRRSPKMSGKLG